MVEAIERKPVEGSCKPWPKGEAARSDEPAAKAAYRCGTEASAAEAAYRCGAQAPAAEATYRCGTEAPAAEASTPAHHRASKATTAKAPAVEASAPAHARIRCRRRCHRAREGDGGGQCDSDLTHHDVSSLLEKR